MTRCVSWFLVHCQTLLINFCCFYALFFYWVNPKVGHFLHCVVHWYIVCDLICYRAKAYSWKDVPCFVTIQTYYFLNWFLECRFSIFSPLPFSHLHKCDEMIGKMQVKHSTFCIIQLKEMVDTQQQW